MEVSLVMTAPEPALVKQESRKNKPWAQNREAMSQTRGHKTVWLAKSGGPSLCSSTVPSAQELPNCGCKTSTRHSLSGFTLQHGSCLKTKPYHKLRDLRSQLAHAQWHRASRSPGASLGCSRALGGPSDMFFPDCPPTYTLLKKKLK